MAVERVDELRELADRAADRAARAGRVLHRSHVSPPARSSVCSSAGTISSSPASNPVPRCEPTWKTTPSASIAHAASTVAHIAEIDF